MDIETLLDDLHSIGKPEWRPVLEYLGQLHKESVRPADSLFPYPWEEIGPGYCYGPAFGHWDIIHETLDVLPADPVHARMQILNFLSLQAEDGLVPGVVYRRSERYTWSSKFTHPPVWIVAVDDYVRLTEDASLLQTAYPALAKQISWFETNRRSPDGGFYYLDIVSRDWESGVDEGVRFDTADLGPQACVDATSHVFNLYATAARWADRMGEASDHFEAGADRLGEFIRERLFDEEVGLFQDIWAVGNPAQRRITFEGMWPMVVGAAAKWQSQMVIDGSLLNPERFYTPHPISTVSMSDPSFEPRMWRGPAWNSMTYWAARGCAMCERHDAAVKLLEPALDDTAKQFQRTGTIWEFYDSLGGHPEDVKRKPDTEFNQPCRDYLGHNPLFAMARLWTEIANMESES